MIRSSVIVFIAAFLLNVAWEEWHSRFYLHYRGVSITHGVLVRAALFDAGITLVAWLLFTYAPPFQGRAWLVFIGLLVFAVGLEIFALETSRWNYTISMPKIPFLGVGLTPSIQLALLAAISFWAASR